MLHPRSFSKAGVSSHSFSFSTFSNVMLTLLAGFVVGCASRDFGPADRNSSIKDIAAPAVSSAVAGVFVPVEVDPKLLTNLEPPQADPVFDFKHHLLVRMPDSRYFVSLFKPDGKIFGMSPASFPDDQAKWDLLTYETSIQTAQGLGAEVSAPRFFAGESVLRAMVKNRKEFGRKIEGNVANDPSFLLEKAVVEAMPKLVPYEIYAITDPTKPFSLTACGSYDPRDYSDVRWHYYCNIPGVFRACQRLIVGKLYQINSSEIFKQLAAKTIDEKGYAEALARLRKEDEESVRTYCLDPAKLTDATLKATYNATLVSYENNWKLAPGSILRFFQNFHLSQVDEATGVNMYDAIMRTGVYDWSFKQQQAVLNAYYGSLKPFAEGAFNPKDSAECSLYREARAISEAKIKGTHCDAAAIRDKPAANSPDGTR